LKISNYLLIAGGKASLSLAMVAPRPADHNLKAAGSNPAPATKPSFQKSKHSSWSSPLGGQSNSPLDCFKTRTGQSLP
ncbi:hypothetical protein, partial [Rhizobium beringeri]|uniref:hypothetical protein n=1 Tax=Rhizobium beringeri TaxID=3019934 RepID=UPI003CF751EC